MDPILELPDAILHHMLSLLPLEEAGKTSALSKRWYRLWLSFAVFNFVQSDFGWTGLSIKEGTERFIKIVDNCLLKFHREEFPMMKFKLHMYLWQNVDLFIDKLIGMAFERDVQELDLYFHDHHEIPYCFPETIFLKHPLRFYSLRKLKLDNIELSEEVIEYIIRNCPSISHFVMRFCVGFKSVSLRKPQKLLFLQMLVPIDLDRVDVEAPNLEFLSFDILNPPAVPINLAGCQNLRSLEFTFGAIMNTDFTSILSCLPSLEVLRMNINRPRGVFKVASPHLKVFILEVVAKYCDCFDDLEIEAPNLETFKYRGCEMISLSSKNARCRWEVELFFGSVRLCIFWFLELARLLARSSSQRKVLSLHLDYTRVEILNPQSLEEVQLAHVELEELELGTYSLSLIDGLLLFLHPKILFISQFLEYEVIELLVNNFWTAKDSNCCTSSIIKCWRHYLKDVKLVRVENCEGVVEGNFSMDNLLEYATKNIGEKLRIQFKLEWSLE